MQRQTMPRKRSEMPRLKLETSDSLNDWYTIERAEHDGTAEMRDAGTHAYLYLAVRISDACVEGTADHMRRIAAGIKSRDGHREKRCAVRIEGDRAFLWSPRNSQQEGECTLAEADALADEIVAKLGATP